MWGRAKDGWRSPSVVCRRSLSIFVQSAAVRLQRDTDEFGPESWDLRRPRRAWKPLVTIKLPLCATRKNHFRNIEKSPNVCWYVMPSIRKTRGRESIIDHGVEKMKVWDEWGKAEDGAALRGPLIPHRWPSVDSATGGPQWKQAEHVWPHSKHFPCRALQVKQGGHVGGERKSEPRPPAAGLEINNRHLFFF